MQSGWIVAFITTVFMVAHGHAAALSLEASLVSKRSSFSADQPVELTLTLKNTGSTPMSIYSWRVNYPELIAPYFQVTLNGKVVPHVGALYKVSTDVLAKTTTLNPGTGKSITIVLSQTHDMTKDGKYTVHFSASASSVTPASTDTSDFSFKSNTVIFTTAGHPNQVLIDSEKYRSEVQTGKYGYSSSCSTSKYQNDILYGYNAAVSYAGSVVAYLDKNGATYPKRYTTWFGARSASNLATVRTHYTKIQGAFSSQTITFNCSDSTRAGIFAYVYPSSPYRIYLCGAYWTAPTTGTDSKGGTIIHEMSHFTVMGGTQDYVYGQPGAKNLALSNPAKAVMNADSHEYFAENWPVL